MDIELTRPIDKFTLVPDRLQRSFGRVFFFVPYRTKVYICARIYDIECYATELALFIPVASLMSLGALVHMCGRRDVSLVREEYRRILEGEEEWMVKYMPRMMRWLRLTTEELEGKSAKARELKEELSFKPLLRPTPEEAVLKNGLYVRRRSEGVNPGAVRIYYFKDPAKAKHGPELGRDQEPEPDAWVDMNVDAQDGVNIGYVRKRWGLESLAIITDGKHVDEIFHPANQDRLSPLAAYDLSKQWREPIKVFEPRTSIVTPFSRKLRNAVYPTLFFLATLFKLLFGFPEENYRYVEALYGRQYSVFYQQAARFLWRARRDLLDLLIIIVCLPYFLVYHTGIGVKAALVWFFMTAAWIFNAILGIGPAAVHAVGELLAYIASWDWTVWFAVGIVGITVAEYRA